MSSHHAGRRLSLVIAAVTAASTSLLLASCSVTNQPTSAREDTAQASGAEGEGELAEGAEWEHELEEQAERRGPEIPEDAFLFSRLMPGGAPDADVFRAARQQADRLRTVAAAGDRTVAGPWRFEGPRTVGGRVVDAAVDPTTPNSLYVATSTNGVWHSADAGKTFTSVWPKDVTHAMGAVAITPDGTLFAGTGEANPGGGSITYGGDGVYRSTDGGVTWQKVGLSGAGTIGRIVVDPQDPDRIWVAVTGNLFVPGATRGLYLSTDGGDTWNRSLEPPNDTTGAADVAVDPEHPDHVIATMWDHIRHPDARVYTGAGSGIWQSRDGGATWQRLGEAEGLQAASPDTGRIGVAFAPSDSDRVYAIYANDETGAFENFFDSTDNGRSWSRSAGADDLADSQSVYGWWFGRVFVDPDNAGRLFALGLDEWESTDGAGSFHRFGTEMHADQHVMAWDPRAPERLYAGNDGGLYVSDHAGADGSWSKGSDQPWSQYASIDVSVQDPTRFAGGLQDNGTIASWTTPPFGSILGGDGQDTLINPQNKENYYACFQYGSCTGWDGQRRFRLPIASARFPYLTQLELDPSDPSTIYTGGDKLNRSTDGGRTFTTITGDLGKGEAGNEPNPIYRGHYGTISAINVAPSDPDTIWAGTDNGYLYRSTDNGASWTELPPPVRPKLWISRITIDPTDASRVYLTFSGYREGDNAPYVLRTNDGGDSWTNITANLPHAPVNDIARVGDRLYVATDVGVFTTPAARPRWAALGRGMPELVTTELRPVLTNDRLYVSTFGMGAWSVALPH
jgi:photosystem II stability/assembly factor-like uncharacterized protein